jgi:hypothetical protein
MIGHDAHCQLHVRLDCRAGVVAHCLRARRPASARGPILQEQARPCLHSGAGEKGNGHHRLGAAGLREGTGPRHRISTFGGHRLQVDNIQITYVFYESGLSINVMYGIDDPSGVRGFKLFDGWRSPMRSPRSSSSLGSAPSWPERSAARISRSNTTADVQTRGVGGRSWSTVSIALSRGEHATKGHGTSTHPR